ncbi:MAG: hypothetical protein M5R40_21520 [Anaerolineae bacterium]|nr:hypothetical protein [Anaerolineae bacterium]
MAVLNDVTQLIELGRLKSEMVRMTSHDLKNPLFAAMSHLELLGRRDVGPAQRGFARVFRHHQPPA